MNKKINALAATWFQACQNETATLPFRAMLEAVLSLLRNDRRLEKMTLADVASTLQLVADQFSEMGHKVATMAPRTRWPPRSRTTCIAASPISWRTR
jgi:hypothetical protein